MNHFNKIDNAIKLFGKINTAKTTFGKMTNNSKQNTHAKVGHFMTAKPSHNNSIERGIRQKPETEKDNIFV